MYTRVQTLVHCMVTDRRRDGSAGAFRRAWIEPGFVRVKRGQPLTIGVWSLGFRPTARRQAGAEQGGTDGSGAETAIYTDGSGGREGAGWGFVVVRDAGEVTARCGRVRVCASHPDWDGAGVETNNTAEITAVIRALRSSGQSRSGRRGGAV